MNKNIVLTGFMGAGKSAVAQKLGSKLDRAIVATDEIIIEIEKKGKLFSIFKGFKFVFDFVVIH